MSGPVDLYSVYARFSDPAYAAVRGETYGHDLGQNSWLTADEFDRFLSWLGLAAGQHILEVACGAGGPALYAARATGCRLTGIDSNAGGIATARRMAEESGLVEGIEFQVADANRALPFEPDSFDAVFCIDAMNHLQDRLGVLREWRRVLRPGRRALFTDPVVFTGPVSNEDLARRSSVGTFLFVPPGVNERLIEAAGLRLIRHEDASDNAVHVADRWRRSRETHRLDLVSIEGAERFDGLQRFLETVHDLTAQRRLSRIVYVIEKPA